MVDFRVVPLTPNGYHHIRLSLYHRTSVVRSRLSSLSCALSNEFAVRASCILLMYSSRMAFNFWCEPVVGSADSIARYPASAHANSVVHCVEAVMRAMYRTTMRSSSVMKH